ncbi:MAG: fibronectin type III domain-containing protein [Candidatus Latescibacteria bacterium]|nr:fibronectin type III domain-containing protein [Candidatus Latescibacterota bacterium]
MKKRVWIAPEGVTGSIDAEIDLDEVLYPSGERGRHDHTLEFNFTANEKNNPPTQSGIESLEIVTDIQVAPNSLPALSRGKNVVRYRDEAQGLRKVRITHIWRERTDTYAPVIPEKPIYPAEGQTISELAPHFKWEQADGDGIERYCVRIALDSLCRWPVATALEKELVCDAEWQLDAGWLNPDTAYYWRVKAMDKNGVWGDWGDVFSFRTAVDAV